MTPLGPDRDRSLLTAGGRIGFYYAALFSVMGAALPYLPVWYAASGLGIAEIAVISTVTPFIRMLAGPWITFIADRRRAHRQVILACSWAGLAAWVLLSQSNAFWPILATMALVTLTGAGLIPLAETIAMAAVRTHGLDYGRTRLWGSVSFIAATLLAGAASDVWGPPAIITFLVAGAAATALAAHVLPDSAEGAAPAKAKLSVTSLTTWLASPPFLAFLLAAGAIQASHAVFYVFGVLHWREQGLSNGWCGALWAVAVVAEIALFWWARKWFAGVGPIVILALGAVAAAVRWAAMAFDPPLAMLFALQVLHALTYAATHLGAMQFLARAVPPDQSATAQGVYALVTSGLAAMLANHVAGLSYAAAGGRAYFAMALMALIALAALAHLARRWDGSEIATTRS
jgi:PPP family 3-phenylpropionic acid transporter